MNLLACPSVSQMRCEFDGVIPYVELRIECERSSAPLATIKIATTDVSRTGTSERLAYPLKAANFNI